MRRFPLHLHRSWSLLLTTLLAAPACDEPLGEAPVGLELAALTGTACGDPSAPNTGANPFDEIGSLTLAVQGPAPGTGIFQTLAKRTLRLNEGSPLSVGSIPEGTNREVVVVANGSSGTWYGRDTGLTVRRSETTAASIVLSRMGAFACLPTPAELENVVFPASAPLGDGRILVTGGFRNVSGSSISQPTAQAFIYDSRTGAREYLGTMGAGLERGAHAMVYVPAANHVIILGGATEIGIDGTRRFPLVLDTANSRDDAVIFDVATKTFRPVSNRMVVGRAFPRTQLMADGTVLVMGGGAWPYVTGDDRYVEVDFYDHLGDGGLGGFLDIPKLRSFYSRVGNSLTLIGNSPEGLSELLVWGGTTVDRSRGNPAEVFRQSGRQREGVNGSFAEVVIVGEEPSFLYFHETTRLSNNRFLVTGGVAHRDGDLQAPAENEAWLLTYVSQPAPTVQAQRLSGFGPGRVFHSALSSDGQNVTVVGGWAGLDAMSPNNLVTTFDLAKMPNAFTVESGATSAVRGGHTALLTPGGTIFLAGGEGSGQPGAVSGRLSSELFTPLYLPRP